MGKPIKITYEPSKSIEVEKNYIVDNYLSQKDNMGYSIVRTHLNGKHPYMKNINSNRTYYLLKGEATFYFDDNRITVEEGDMIVIPKDTKFAFKGIFDAILVDSPAFNPDDDVIYNEEIEGE